MILRLLAVLLFGLAMVPIQALSPVPLRAEQGEDGAAGSASPFGVNFINSADIVRNEPHTIARRYEQAREMGAAWHRWPLYWGEVQSGRGQMDFDVYDSVVESDLANGLSSSVVLLGTPDWASTAGIAVARPPKLGDRIALDEMTASGRAIASVTSLPQGLSQPVFLPDGSINAENTWGYFVYTAASRFRGQVKAWEIWNEPDYWLFWAGSPADYYRLLKVGYAAVKRADPGATVLFGGLSFWFDSRFLGQVLDAARADPTAPGNAYYFDVLALHFYVDPRHLLDKPAWAWAEMRSRGISKPIWINEANVSLCGELAAPACPSRWRASTDEQASYVMQAFAYALAAGVEKIFIFQLYDDGNIDGLFGLMRNDGSARPAYLAYQTATRYFGSAGVTARSFSEAVNAVTFSGNPPRRVSALWNFSSQSRTAQPAASMAEAALIDKIGRATAIRPEAGKFNVPLPGATNYVDGAPSIGGSPYLLVEDGAPRARLFFPVTRR